MLRMTTTLQKCQQGQCLRLPDEILQAALFSENETVEISADKAEIVIQKVQKIETLDDLFNNYNGTYHCQEVDTGEPVGYESW